MMPAIITLCCTGATHGESNTHPVANNVSAVRTENLLATQPVSTTPPAPASAMAAYRIVESWVRAWNIPSDADQAPLPPVGAAAVVLRLHGAVIGRGSDATEGPSAVLNAARTAFAEAARRMPVENDALREDAVRQLAADVTISLELAGAMIPLNAPSFEHAAARLSPGVDGVAARIGVKLATVFPSTLLMQSTPPVNALRSVASQAADDATFGLNEMAKLVADHDARFYRFRVTHLAQPSAGAAPVFLYRGGRVVNLPEITVQELRAMADRIAEHVLTRAWPGIEPFGMMGTYDAARGVYDPRIASPTEQLTASLALVRYAASFELLSPRRAELLAFVDVVLADLEKIDAGKPDISTDPVAAAAWVVTTTERAKLEATPARSDAPRPTEFADQCRRTVLASFRMDQGYAQTLPVPAHPLTALALVRMAAEEAPGALRDEAMMLASSAVRRVFQNAATGDLVARMPWLGWAELELALLRGDDHIPSAVSLREMRSLVWAHQVSLGQPAASDAQGGGPDMVGGIVFDAGASSNTVLPTWQSARPVSFIATMLTDPRLSPPSERPLELAKLIGALRFLRQLQVDDTAAWISENRRKAIGGVRSAAWDQKLPLDASAMTLMTICETLRALDVMSAK